MVAGGEELGHTQWAAGGLVTHVCVQVLKKLGKGAQGSVFLCEDKITHVNYVMKKVECNDEGEANKAFKEVRTDGQSHK